MDSNGCDMDVDVRLPPRKRLLAGLKKQSCSESTSQCSPENNSSLSVSPSIDECSLSEFDVRLSSLLKSYKNGSNMSPEEIALAAKSAAEAAAKAAEVARAAAEEKAVIAAKAVVAAKSALDLVAYEETSSRYHKKNKLKKHALNQLLYTEYQPFGNCGEDEELARRLHRAMNSSPRIFNHSPGSKAKNHKQLKIHLPSNKSGVTDGTSMREGNVKYSIGETEGRMECEGSNEDDSYTVKVAEKVPKSSMVDKIAVDSGEAESSYLNEKSFEGTDYVCTNGRTRKRGRIKQKRLPLSICTSKDQTNPKEECNLTNSLLTRAGIDKSTARHLSLLSGEPSVANVTPVEVPPTWKCQDFKVSQCIKQDKLVQS